MFGLRNTTITSVYSMATMAKDDYGSVILANPSVVSFRVWLEENTSYRRGNAGDAFTSSVRCIGDLLSEIVEGDVIETVRDAAIGESAVTQRWRVETKNKFYSSKRSDGRIGRMELILVEEK